MIFANHHHFNYKLSIYVFNLTINNFSFAVIQSNSEEEMRPISSGLVIHEIDNSSRKSLLQNFNTNKAS